MQPTAISLSALLVVATLVPGPPRPAGLQQGGALQRVMPPGGDDEPGEELFAREFDSQRWRARLGATDLDRRERTYEMLLQRAGFDPAARLFLEDLAKDTGAGELAWTARLALRELGRSRFGGRRLPGGLPGNLGGASPLESLMQDFFARGDTFSFPRPFAAPGAVRPVGPKGDKASVSGRSIHLQQENGRLRLEVVETVDGEPQQTVYEGNNLDEILAQEPGLAKQLGSLRFRFGSPFDLPALPQRAPDPVVTDKLGVLAQPLTPEHARELGLDNQGLYVEHSAPGTYAYLLGIGMGDVLLELDAQPVRTVEDVGRIMAERDPEAPLRAIWVDELGQRRSKSWPPEPEAKKR